MSASNSGTFAITDTGGPAFANFNPLTRGSGKISKFKVFVLNFPFAEALSFTCGPDKTSRTTAAYGPLFPLPTTS